MMFGHLPGSYATMTLTEKLWRRGLTPQEGKTVYACGILAGVAPDVDVLFAGITEHRGSIVHTPFFRNPSRARTSGKPNAPGGSPGYVDWE
jgi:hypothetical protein